jgi:hypothetical protein
MGGFGLDFVGARYSLYKRGKSNFPLLGMLLAHPECWRPEMRDELLSERQRMDAVLPEYSGLFPFADLIVGYSNTDDGKAFFDAHIDGDEWFDEMRRFAGYRFLEMGYHDLAVNLIGGVRTKKPRDYLASALAKIKAGNYEIAALIIDDFAQVQWPVVKDADLLLQSKLYQMIEQQRSLTPLEQKRTKELKGQLEQLGYSDLESGQPFDVKSLCTLPFES